MKVDMRRDAHTFWYFTSSTCVWFDVSGKWKWDVTEVWLNSRLIGWLLSFLPGWLSGSCSIRDDEQCFQTRVWQLSEYSAEQFDKPASRRKLMSLKCLYPRLSFHSFSLMPRWQQYLISSCIYSGDSESLREAMLNVWVWLKISIAQIGV